MDSTLSRTSTTLLNGVAYGGDACAERRFVERYGNLARAVAQAAGVHSNDIEDVVQETVVAAVQGLRDGRYSRGRGAFKSWFKGIVFNKISRYRRDYARRAGCHRVEGIDGLDQLPDKASGPPEQMEEAYEREWEAIVFAEASDEVRGRVDPVNWQAYDLVQRQGMKPGIVASLLGIRRSHVYNAVSRIKGHLSETVQELRGE